MEVCLLPQMDLSEVWLSLRFLNIYPAIGLGCLGTTAASTSLGAARQVLAARACPTTLGRAVPKAGSKPSVQEGRGIAEEGPA